MLNAKQLYEYVIDLKGADNQINQAVEEMAELIQALNKVRRAGVKFTDPTPEREHVLAEMADVQHTTNVEPAGTYFRGIRERNR